MKAKRFISRPFLVTAYLVTSEDMAAIAKWCQGNIIDDEDAEDPRPFIRVPVDRPMSKKQTQAYVGSWILLSVKRNGEESFKVYTPDWLERNFFEVPREIEELDSTPDEVAQVEDVCCCKERCTKKDNVRTFPVPRPPLARTPTASLERVPAAPLSSPFRS